ncbi:glycosyltransferase family 4 protein [Sulfitobacter marinus]|nr:glycosyltransferase family 4 protein [Sulfitobacter marinus]
MARALIAALEYGGATVTLASTLRSRDGTGDSALQTRLLDQAQGEIARFSQLGRAEGWQAWVTYHNYYKAPDLIGPSVARHLGIPYLLIEASRARKRLIGPWARFAKATETASDAADVIFYFTHRDAETLERDRAGAQQLIHLPPFLMRSSVDAAAAPDGHMLAVGMLREGDKLASYKIIADTLAQLPDTGWSLRIAGDGAARARVEALMAPFGPAVQFLGQLDADALADVYRTSSLLFWPGVNEAFGLAYLEGQAAGLPVVAQDRPGVRDVLAPGDYPDPAGGIPPLAARLQKLLSDSELRHRLGRKAQDHVAAHHLLPAASATLFSGLAKCGVYR